MLVEVKDYNYLFLFSFIYLRGHSSTNVDVVQAQTYRLNINTSTVFKSVNYTELQKLRFIFNINCLVVKDNFNILCIQINLPAYKDYLYSNFKWFDSHAKSCGEKG